MKNSHKFSIFSIMLLLTFRQHKRCSCSRFSILWMRFCCKYRHLRFFWLSRFSILSRPLHSSHRHFSPVYSSKFSMQGNPEVKLKDIVDNTYKYIINSFCFFVLLIWIGFGYLNKVQILHFQAGLLF